MLHVKFEFHSNRDTLTYFTAKNRSKSFICINGLKNHVAAWDLVHTYIVSVLIPTDFRHGWAIFGPMEDKNTWKGVLLELPAREKFSGLFCTCFEISVWNLAYTSSGLYHTSSLSFIPIWTLWPTLQPKIGQSHLSAYMALIIIQRPQIWYTHSNSECLDPYWFCHAWAIFGPLVAKNTRKGKLVEFPASDTCGSSFKNLKNQILCLYLHKHNFDKLVYFISSLVVPL